MLAFVGRGVRGRRAGRRVGAGGGHAPLLIAAAFLEAGAVFKEALVLGAFIGLAMPGER